MSLKSLLTGKLNHWRSEGDRLRDAHEYAAAAEAYAKHLADEPEDFGIWVQRGNCLKDAGELEEAEIAYQTAEALKPEDADLHLQMGHLLKMQGRIAEAELAYGRSAELDPDGYAQVELQALAGGPAPEGVAEDSTADELEDASPLTCVDVTDLIWFLEFHNRVTGIQRVVSCVAAQIANGAPIGSYGFVEQGGRRVLLTYFDSKTQRVYALENRTFHLLIEEILSREAPQQIVDRLRSDVLTSKVAFIPRRGDRYVIAGAFWSADDYVPALMAMKAQGVTIGVYIYDLIPFTHPQYVTQSTLADVRAKFADVLSLMDFGLTISNFVAEEVRGLLKTQLDTTPPVLAAPLGHDLPPSVSESEEDDALFEEGLAAEFVLCVGTIEMRKNPGLLLDVWTSLNRKYAGRIPHLIFAGKWGWDIDDFRQRLAGLHYVDGKVIVLNEVSDARLKVLYQRCLFTVFPSFAEGWGLPVGESLAYGKPCLASNATSIPEVGGDFCRYLSPHDPLSAAWAIERLIQDRNDLQAWTDRVANEFHPRGWGEVTRDFLDRLEQGAQQAESLGARPAVRLKEGMVHRLRRQTRIDASNSWRDNSLKFLLGAGWWPVEDWGAWSKSPRAAITFATDLPAGAKVRVLAQVWLPPPAPQDVVVVGASDGLSSAIPLAQSYPRWVQIAGEIDEAGQLSVYFERVGMVRQEIVDHPLYVGLSAVAFHRSDNLIARLDLFEEIALFGTQARGVH